MKWDPAKRWGALWVRHDPCIVPRAVPVIEAAAALAACEVLGI